MSYPSRSGSGGSGWIEPAPETVAVFSINIICAVATLVCLALSFFWRHRAVTQSWPRILLPVALTSYLLYNIIYIAVIAVVESDTEQLPAFYVTYILITLFIRLAEALIAFIATFLLTQHARRGLVALKVTGYTLSTVLAILAVASFVLVTIVYASFIADDNVTRSVGLSGGRAGFATEIVYVGFALFLLFAGGFTLRSGVRVAFLVLAFLIFARAALGAASGGVELWQRVEPGRGPYDRYHEVSTALQCGVQFTILMVFVMLVWVQYRVPVVGKAGISNNVQKFSSTSKV